MDKSLIVLGGLLALFLCDAFFIKFIFGKKDKKDKNDEVDQSKDDVPPASK